MSTRVEKLQESLQKEYRKIDIRRLKKVRGYFDKANDVIKAGPLHHLEFERLNKNIQELIVETISRLDDAIKVEA